MGANATHERVRSMAGRGFFFFVNLVNGSKTNGESPEVRLEPSANGTTAFGRFFPFGSTDTKRFPSDFLYSAFYSKLRPPDDFETRSRAHGKRRMTIRDIAPIGESRAWRPSSMSPSKFPMDPSDAGVSTE